MTDSGISRVRTGDILLFSNNTSTGFMLRTATGSLWNHAGIAVRLLPKSDRISDVNRISLDYSGELYILEINTGKRQDGLTGERVVGAAISPWSYAADMYNIISVRKLDQKYRSVHMKQRTADFIRRHAGTVFSGGLLPFIGVAMGVPLAGTKKRGTIERPEMFCTELIIHYYLEVVLGRTDLYIDEFELSRAIISIFGSNAPQSICLWTPEHFTYQHTSNSTYLPNEETTIYHQGADIFTAILQPLVLVLFIIVIAAMFFFFK